MRRNLTIYVVLSLLVFAQVAVSPARATESVDKMIEQTRSALQAAKKKEQSALSVLTKNQSALNKIQSNLNSISNQLHTAQVRVSDVRAELRRTEAELAALEEALTGRRDLLRKRITAFYRYGPISYLEVLFSATSLADLINRYELTGYFIRCHLNLIEDYRETRANVAEKRDQIQEQNEELTERTMAISALQEKARKEKLNANVKVQLTQQEVARIQADRVRLEQALLEYERLSKELGSEMRRTGSGVALGSGTMMWPVLGRLSSSFGWRRHPVLKSSKFHNGQDIAVPKGTPVLAADSGVIRIASWQGGYGYLVAIDHGRGLSTFYGHNSVLLVKVGDVVVKGQRVSSRGAPA